MIRNVPVPVAAAILGKGAQFVRIGLQRERLPIGTAIKAQKAYSYHVSPKLLCAYSGCTMEDIEEEVVKWNWERSHK